MSLISPSVALASNSQHNEAPLETALIPSSRPLSPNLGDRLFQSMPGFNSLPQAMLAQMGICGFELGRCPALDKIVRAVDTLFTSILQLDPSIQESFIEEATRQFESSVHQQLAIANVSAPSQLCEKLTRLSSLRKIAEDIFIRTQSLCALYIQLDEATVMSAFGELSQHHKEILHAYWNYISKAENGPEIHSKIENAVAESFSELITAEPLETSLESTVVDFAVAAFDRSSQKAQRIYDALVQKRAQCTNADEQLQLDYTILKYELIGKSFVKYFIRQQLAPLAQILEDQLSNTASARAVLEMRGCFLKSELKFAQELGDPEEIARVEQEVFRLVDFMENPRAYLQEMHHIADPEAIVRLMPIMTEHDKAVLKAYDVEAPINATPGLDILRFGIEELSPDLCVAELQRNLEKKIGLFQQASERVTRITRP